MMDIFNSKNAVIMSFLPFSGGKFLGNCLSLSKDFCPQDPVAAEYLLDHPADYDYRLEVVLKTLPPPDKMHLWQNFEHGDRQLYGSTYENFWLQGIKGEANTITKKLCDSTMRFFITDHGMEPFGLCKVWPNATIVRLINPHNFQAICLRKKLSPPLTENPPEFNGNYCLEKYNMLRGSSWPNWDEFQRYGYDVTKFNSLDQGIVEEIGLFYRVHLMQNQVILYDVDQSYFDTDAFLLSVKRLYEQFGLLDFSPDLIKSFYEKYISLHI